MKNPQPPKYAKLWHKEYIMLSMAGLLANMVSYILLLPIIFSDTSVDCYYLNSLYNGESYLGERFLYGLVYFVGMVFSGPFVNRLASTGRRKYYCLFSLIAWGFLILLHLLTDDLTPTILRADLIHFLLRFWQGFFYGWTMLLLVGILIVDKSEPGLRTEANTLSVWLLQMAISIGPIAYILAVRETSLSVWLPLFLVLLSALTVSMVSFPFRAPDETSSLFSLDRFFLPKSIRLTVNLLLYALAIGIMMGVHSDMTSHLLLLVGLLVALSAKYFVFKMADLKSEIVIGHILLMAAILLHVFKNADPDALLYIPILLGISIGLTGLRFMVFFIRLKSHCERSTALATYLIVWEITFGTGWLAKALHCPAILTYTVSAVSVCSLLLYSFYTHDWYMRHKNR